MSKIPKQTDRERILTVVAGMLALELASRRSFDHTRMEPCSTVHVEWFSKDLKKGDLVVCMTSVGRNETPWNVSFVEEKGIPGDPNGALLRAIGTKNFCRFGNESFAKIVGIPEEFLWEGERYEFAAKVRKAFGRIDSYAHRFGGIEFSEEPGIAFVTVREVFEGTLRSEKGSEPYVFTIRYDKKITIKEIVRQMKQQGFGIKEFRIKEQI